MPQSSDGTWNPRFANFARVHGRSPAEQLEAGRQEFPAGGCMIPFVQWNKARLVEYSKINPAAFIAGGLHDHDAYDAWLDSLPVNLPPPIAEATEAGLQLVIPGCEKRQKPGAVQGDLLL